MSYVRWSETQDGTEWDTFVARNNGSIFHTWSWRKVLESTNSKPLYLACRDAKGELLAVCPFFYQKAGRGLMYLLSLPLTAMAGPIIDDRVIEVPQILKSLPKAIRFSPFNPVVSMQVIAYQQPVINSLNVCGYPHHMEDGLFILDLHEKTPDYIWKNGFEKHDRQAIKYYEQNDSLFGFASNEHDYADYFALHEASVERGKEQPLISTEFLAKMRLNMGDRLKVTLVRVQDKVVAGFSMICDPANSTVHLRIIGYSRTKNIHSPIIYIDWKIINWALENGFRYVDFGSTSPKPTNPVHKLKARFGGTFVPRYRFTLPISGIPYSFVTRVNRTVKGVKSSITSKGNR
jgi:CelD/BcsL family acetyltransferase involved in cellulose biosynthesis